jgi:pimeloyl-ACP methyl ester carboxylesterase
MPFFDHDGLKFHYRDEGSGLPFVFQHGLGADLDQPFSLLRPPPGIRLIAFDCRAHGQTHPLGDVKKLGLATFADDLFALLDFLEIKNAIVGGISMGASVTLNFTLRHPEIVRGLVLSRPAWTDKPHPWNVHIFTLISRLIDEHGPKHGQQVFRETPEYKEAAQKWPDVARSLLAQFESPSVEETVCKFTRIILDRPCDDLRQLSAISVPTLVLANDQDPIHPLEFGPILARAIPNAQFRQITSKSVSVEQHEREVQDALEQFLRQHFIERAW